MAQLKLVAMSAVLTIIVWVSADQLLTESATIRIAIDPRPVASNTYTARLADPEEKVLVEVSGPQKTIARLRETPLTEITLPIERLTTGDVELLDALEHHWAKPLGLVVNSVIPKYLTVVVDHQITVAVPVWVDPGTLDYDVDPSVEPDRVQATISAELFEAIPQERRRVVLDAEKLLRNKPAGELLSFPVPLEAKIDGVDAAVLPAQVTLRANVRQQHITDTIAAVPIHFAGSVDLWEEFRIELRDHGTLLTQPIAVRGPAELVARLVAGDLKVTGLIALNRDDAMNTGGFRVKRPTFVGLPHKVELANPAAIPNVEFRLVRSESPAS